MSHSERELARERCKTLAGFIREFFPLLHPGQPYVHSWNIDFLCAHLEAITFWRDRCRERAASSDCLRPVLRAKAPRAGIALPSGSKLDARRRAARRDRGG